jgi:hypothetical protein
MESQCQSEHFFLAIKRRSARISHYCTLIHQYKLEKFKYIVIIKDARLVLNLKIF